MCVCNFQKSIHLAKEMRHLKLARGQLGESEPSNGDLKMTIPVVAALREDINNTKSSNNN